MDETLIVFVIKSDVCRFGGEVENRHHAHHSKTELFSSFTGNNGNPQKNETVGAETIN